MGASLELHAKIGPRRVRDEVTPHDPWTNFGPFSDGCRLLPEGLSSVFFPGIFWTHGRTSIAGISRFGEVAWHPGLYRFLTCALCHEVSHRELFANNSALPFVVLPAFFQSSHKIRDHRWGRNKDQFKNWKLCGLWKLLFRHHGAIKLTQNCVCFTNPHINPFVPTFVPREYHPELLEPLHLLQCISAHLQKTLPWAS